MSMEIYVLSDRRLASVDAWQKAIDEAGLPLRLSGATPFAKLHGALPVVLNRRQTAFECDHCKARELMTETPSVDFGRAWTYALAFRWGGDVYAGASAYAAAAAYAEATGGIIFDCQEGKLISLQQAVDTSRELPQSQSVVDEAIRHVIEQFKKENPRRNKP
ncbi:hypothetical protein FNL55_09605 [Tardiphaga sp. vice352]|uniref:hypothetical protein n=1 Tax=unclassified Tardiphaga TaxID=2631404 RepID=UPI0011652E3A|nr:MULTISPECIES: hypothetical protein [unclassified Tardiphaga]QDM16255.1 hypothetical protein FNL53_10280 [Tardiphaga sp. vice278]QDM21279.1 hypothetical protein FIU28_09195 [Tardiphaga sp. vice154]QDM26464.1 hypothetical protein FNL56_10440 [Tardiphaga sp. vice304]QDM31530.1 hypothetical protein FNL55_09605 [Tardiphaga sp. vice352]